MFNARNSHTVTVALTDDQIAAVTAFATRIELANRKNKRDNKQGLDVTDAESLAMRVSGYCGEAAFAIHLGLDPIRIADEWRARPDVGKYNVRTTKRLDGRLIITPRDAKLSPIALVVDTSPLFYICGWYLPNDARTEPAWWYSARSDGGAWYVPQQFLHPIDPERDAQAVADAEAKAADLTITTDWRQILRDAGAAPPDA